MLSHLTAELSMRAGELCRWRGPLSSLFPRPTQVAGRPEPKQARVPGPLLEDPGRATLACLGPCTVPHAYGGRTIVNGT